MGEMTQRKVTAICASQRKLGVLGSGLVFNRYIKIYNLYGDTYILGQLKTDDPDDPDDPARVSRVTHLRILFSSVDVNVKFTRTDLNCHDPERPVQYVAPQHSQPSICFLLTLLSAQRERPTQNLRYRTKPER